MNRYGCFHGALSKDLQTPDWLPRSGGDKRFLSNEINVSREKTGTLEDDFSNCTFVFSRGGKIGRKFLLKTLCNSEKQHSP